MGWIDKLKLLWQKRGEIASDFMDKWEAKDGWARGLFQGEVLGWVMMTVLIIILTAGTSAIAQIAGKWKFVIDLLKLAERAGDLSTYVRTVGRLPGEATDIVRKKFSQKSEVDLTPAGSKTGVDPSPLGAKQAQQPTSSASTQLKEPATSMPAIPPGVNLRPRVLKAADYITEKITEGRNAGKLKLTDKNGQKFLFKPLWGEDKKLIGPELGIMAGDRYRRVPAAAYLARKAGIETPAGEVVELDKKVGSLQKWVDEGETLAEVSRRDRSLYLKARESQPKLDLDIFDYVIANLDRNPGNLKVVIDPKTGSVQKVIPIDMDISLPPNRARYSRGPNTPWKPFQMPLPSTMSKGLYDNLTRMKKDWKTISQHMKSYLTEAEIDGALFRLNEVLEKVHTGKITVRR
jgi:hypothetical protein